MGCSKLTWLALASTYLSVGQSTCLRFYVFHLSAPHSIHLSTLSGLVPTYSSTVAIFSIHPLPSIHSSMHLSISISLYPYIPIAISKSLNPCLETRSLSLSKYQDLHMSFHLNYIHTSIYLSIYIFISLFHLCTRQ